MTEGRKKLWKEGRKEEIGRKEGRKENDDEKNISITIALNIHHLQIMDLYGQRERG